jgi:PilZ domain
VAVGDLERFRQALDRLQAQLVATPRPSRFKPTSHLMVVEVRLGEEADGAPAMGEILDLSSDGMKIAMDTFVAIEAEQPCQLLVTTDDDETFHLKGTVRWVEAHPYITVFGVEFLGAERPGQTIEPLYQVAQF